ncbi:MAG: ATP synthase F1 subunit delta [bacterium]
MKSVDLKNLAHILLETTDGVAENESNKSLKDFAQYLVKKNLISQFDEIISEYSALYNKKHNILEATVTKTTPLTDKAKQELSEALKNKYKANEVTIKEKIDSKLIGGMKIKIGDTVVDNSLSNSLYQLETQLLK